MPLTPVKRLLIFGRKFTRLISRELKIIIFLKVAGCEIAIELSIQWCPLRHGEGKKMSWKEWWFYFSSYLKQFVLRWVSVLSPFLSFPGSLERKNCRIYTCHGFQLGFVPLSADSRKVARWWGDGGYIGEDDGWYLFVLLVHLCAVHDGREEGMVTMMVSVHKIQLLAINRKAPKLKGTNEMEPPEICLYFKKVW